MDPEEELKQYRAWHAAMTKDPEIRKEFQKVLKKAVPTAATPDLDNEEKINSKLEAELKARDEKIAALEEARLRADLNDKYKGQRDELSGPPYNFDDEDIAEVEKLIKDEGMPDYKVAAKYYAALKAPLKPSGLGIGGTSRSKSMREERKNFNDRFKGVFKRPGQSAWQKTFDDAYDKVRSGAYLKE
jgi:hypothetical protein